MFAARRCQGGGETWGAILQAVVARRGSVDPIVEESPGWTGAVFKLGGRTRFSIDGEGDAVRFCADDPRLVAGMRADYERLNAATPELEQAMAATTALQLECREVDGTVPKLPELNQPPELPHETVAATLFALAQLKAALERDPVWCFPPDDPERRAGALRFTADGHADWIATSGKTVGQGRWTSLPAEYGDDRIEVIIEPLAGAAGARGLLTHFDLGKSGRIGFDLIGDKIVRSEMVPGDACLAGRGKGRPGVR